MSSPKIPESVLDQIESHVTSVTDREVGGVLVGSVGDGSADDTEIVAAIPALKAIGASMNVTFTHEVWDEALQIVDRDHPGRKIVGWYHSHPDFGVFLSDYDMFIHENFFPLPGMMALVVDPIRGDAGWFTTVEESVVQTASFAIEPVAAQSVNIDQAPVSSSASRSRTYSLAVFGAAAVLIAFSVGWITSPGNSGSSGPALSTAELTAAQSQKRIGELEEALAQAQKSSGSDTTPQASKDSGSLGTGEPNVPATAPSEVDAHAPLDDPHADPQGGDSADASFQITYLVKPNDSLWSIAKRFYGDGNRWTELAAANALTSGNIDPGDTLIVTNSGGRPGTFAVRSSGE